MRNALRLAGIALAVLTSTMRLHAAVFNVPGDFSTIQAALNAAQNGDTVLVAPGTYTQSLNFNGRAIELRSTAGPNVTTIQGSGGTAVTIGGAASLIGFRVTGGQASFGAGVSVSGTGTVIRGNVFDGNQQGAGGFGAAIGGNSASPLIERNVFRNNTADNQFLSGVVSFVNSSSPRIINNVFESNPARAINLTLPVGNNPQVINNTIVGNEVGIRVDARVATALQLYRNNILANNGIGLEIDFLNPGNEPTFTNNLLFANTTNYDGISDQTGTNGNLLGNPLFAGPNDYRLTQGSPAIDAGTALQAPLSDFLGVPRPIDGNGDGIPGFDIGAFELPEPSSSSALVLAGAALAVRRRRRIHFAPT
jgi:hypothetical protein